MADFSKENNLSKFEKEFLSELLNDIEKRENSSWAKSWDFVETQNAFSGHKYSGMNDLFLELMSRARKLDDPRFATFNQARKNNYFIKKGSKGLPIQFFSFINKETNKQWNEKDFREKIKNMTPEQIKEEASKKRAIAKTFHVFNAKDMISKENNKSLSENIPITKFNKKVNTNKMIDEFENNLIKNMKVGFNERHSEGAFYTPALDEVTMPLKEQFNSYEERMATLLHELGHATGHEDRLKRDLSGTFGTTNYSKEEFKVEMNSVFMTNTLGLEISDNQKQNHLKYLDSWGKTIKAQPKEFLYALNDSLKIKEFMIDNGKFNDIFLEKEEDLEIDLESAKEFSEAFKKFSSYEYEQNNSVDEILDMIKEENYILPIAYTEQEDSLNTFHFEQQVSYDLKKEILINQVQGDFFSFTNNQDMPIKDMTDNLEGAGFDDFISQHNMGLDLDEITDVVKLATYQQSETAIENYVKENNIISEKVILPNNSENLNHILKDVDDDFFKTHNIDKPENFIQDIEYKSLVNYQVEHFESIKEIPFDQTYKLEYNSDIDENKNTKSYSNYKDLWEENFKNDFINDFDNLTLEEIENNDNFLNTPDLINKLAKNDNEVANAFNNAKKYRKSTKERDLDNDGVPDRIDIDDTRNSVQTTADLHKVGNKTDKTHEDKKENHKEEKKIEEEQQQKVKPKSRTR